ncbi:hypothetical protein ACP4OV_015145 [Aristida adscensionis]
MSVDAPTRTGFVSRCVFHHSHPLGDDRSDADGTDTPEKDSGEPSQPPSWHSTQSGNNGNVVQGLLEHFKKMRAENPAFCYAVQLDGGGRVVNFVWVAARARLLYKWFGDAAVLDFDHLQEEYIRGVLFVALTGLNHHRQVIVFGCALMTDGSEGSFVWLFKTWLAFMGGKKLVSLTIGYNRPVEMAATKVFDAVRHRFCRRGIFSNCKERLANVYAAHPTFKRVLKNVQMNGRELMSLNQLGGFYLTSIISQGMSGCKQYMTSVMSGCRFTSRTPPCITGFTSYWYVSAS